MWRVYTIAFVVGFGSILVQLFQSIADNAMYASDRIPRPGNVTFALHFTLEPLVIMMVIFLIGETFRRGVALREDVEGLV